MTRDELVGAGYREFPVNRTVYPHADALFSKTVYAEDGQKAYFIMAALYDFTSHSPVNEIQFSFESYLYFADREQMRVSISSFDYPTLDRVETFFRDTYAKLGCVPDPHNN